MDLVVVGSKPTRHPYRYGCRHAFVAQLDRATDFESVGRTFEPCRTQTCRNIGPLAQLVEQQTLNLWVKGSIPLWLKEEIRKVSPFFYLNGNFMTDLSP